MLMTWRYLLLTMFFVASVSFGDVAFRKAVEGKDNFLAVLLSPWAFLGAIGYLVQVVGFLWLFYRKIDLSSVGLIQTGLYAAIVFSCGVAFFNETVTQSKVLWAMVIVLAVIGFNNSLK